MQLRNQRIELRPGVCIWMRPGGYYEAEHIPEQPLGVTFIHFVPYDPDGAPCLTDDRLPPELFYVRDLIFFDANVSKIIRLLQDQTVTDALERAAQIGQAHTILAALIQELLRPQSSQPESGWERYRRDIEAQVARLLEQPATAPAVCRLAREVGLAPDYYTRIFRRLTGATPRELIQRARLQRAQQLLRETDLAVGAVADQAGYADAQQFSRLFRHRMGMPPGRWRRSRR